MPEIGSNLTNVILGFFTLIGFVVVVSTIFAHARTEQEIKLKKLKLESENKLLTDPVKDNTQGG